MTEMNANGTYPYQPSNGTEGEMFMEKFCYRCRWDQAFQRSQSGEDGCPIVVATMTHNPGDTFYPLEWISDNATGKNPRCTAFESIPGKKGG